MCGIVGYVGKRLGVDVLIKGLKCLEYRGYDSAGIALARDQIQIVKSVGKVSNLEDKIKSMELVPASIGIAHTRWATHGIPSEVNAHPHKVGRVVLVHNGIVENASLLKKQLLEEKVVFKTDTDTEVLAALINKYYDGNNCMEAILKAVNLVEGSYALGILFEGKDEMYAIRKDSPLILGVGDNEYFIASDIMPIINYTDRYMLLEEGEIAKINFSGIEVYNDKIELVKKKVLKASMNAFNQDKCGYEHYMLKEINEEPLLVDKFTRHLEDLPDLSSYEEIHIVACGSAMYAGMIGKSLLEENTNIRVVCDVASEYRYRHVVYDRKTIVILISQSGETADTIAAMRKANSCNVLTLGIVNVEGSTIARECSKVIYTKASSEVAVATTKAYILQVLVMALLCCKCVDMLSDIKKELSLLPRLIKEVIDRDDEYQKVAKKIFNSEDIYFIGRKIDYAVALEGSLKLKEISYIHSEAYQAGELKHGTISLIEDKTPVFAIITDEEINSKTLSNLAEVKARGAMTIVVSNEKIEGYDLCITVPKVNKFLQPLLVVPCLQLIAYEVARLRGCDIDKPKNLAKSVTVE